MSSCGCGSGAERDEFEEKSPTVPLSTPIRPCGNGNGSGKQEAHDHEVCCNQHNEDKDEDDGDTEEDKDKKKVKSNNDDCCCNGARSGQATIHDQRACNKPLSSPALSTPQSLAIELCCSTKMKKNGGGGCERKSGGCCASNEVNKCTSLGSTNSLEAIPSETEMVLTNRFLLSVFIVPLIIFVGPSLRSP